MGIVIQKTADGLGVLTEMSKEDKFEYIKVIYKQAKNLQLNYYVLTKEINTYTVEVPEQVDIVDLSNMNKLYAIVQNFASRVGDIEREAISNKARWEKVYSALKSYLLDKESELYITEDIKSLANARLQAAAVRTQLREVYDELDKVESCKIEADGFVSVLESKRKDLINISNALNRQVKTLVAERGQF